MKNYFKLFISCALALSIFVLFNGSIANAETLKAEETNLVTIEEYEGTLSKIYASYGIEWKITDYSNAKPITKELLDSQIEQAHKEGQEVQAENDPNGLLNTANKQKDSDLYRVMPVRTTRYGYTEVSSWPLYMAELQAIADITYNADTDAIMYLHDFDVIISSGFNYNNWVDDGSSGTISGTLINAKIKGTVYFSYTEPATGFTITKGIYVNRTVYL